MKFSFPPSKISAQAVAHVSRRFLSTGRLAALSCLLLTMASASPAATVNWIHATGDRNWSTADNWSGGTPANANDIIFNNIDAQITNTPANTVDATTTVRSLSYTNSYTSGAAYLSFQNTIVGPGQVLTVTNGLNVGAGDTTGYSADAYTYATVSGAGGTFLVTGGNVSVGNQALSTSPSKFAFAVLDMRGLDNFNYSSASGSLLIAALAHPRQCGTVYLAGTNTIAASAISLGIIQQNLGSLGGILHLGQSNNLYADTFTIGKLQRTNVIDFQAGLTAPFVRIRARDGVHAVANMYLGWNANSTTSSSHATGTNDFSAGVVDAVINNLYLGWYTGISASGFAARVADGAFIMSTSSRNSLVVQNLFVGSITNTAAVDTPSSTGVLDVRGGTVSAGTVTLAQQVVATSTARGTIKLTGGSMNVSGDIIAGGGTSSIIVSNATLTVAGTIGTSSQSLTGLSFSNNAALALTLSSGTSARVFTTNFTVGSASTISLDASAWSVGQFPLIAYQGSVRGLGVAGLTLATPPGVVATLVDNTANHTVDVLITETPGIKWSGAVNSVWDIGGTLNWSKNGIPTNYTEAAGSGPQVTFDDSAINTTVQLSTTVAPDGVLAQNAAKTYLLSGSGKLGGEGGISKQGTGTLILANGGLNDYSGVTTVTAGTLQIGNGGTTGTLGSGGLSNDGTVIFNRTDNVAVSGPVTGTGGLQQQGAGVVSIPNVTSYTGPIIINAGVLALGSSGSLTLSGLVSGSGSFGVVGSGTVILANNNDNYAGGTVIYSGTLQIGDGSGNGVLPAGAVVDNGSLVINIPNPFTLANNLSGTGSVSSVSGDLTLSGVNTHSGLTIRKSGTISAGSATGFSPVSPVVIGDTAGTSIGSLDCGTFSPTLGGLAVGGNNLLSMSSLSFGATGQTLSINGNVGIGNTGSTTTGGLNIFAAGNNSLAVRTNGGFIQLGLCASGQGTQPNNLTVDLSPLSAFSAELGSAGALRVGETNPYIRGSSAGITPYNIFTLAGSNVISAGMIGVGVGGMAFTPELHLGTGANRLYANTINIGTGTRDSGRLVFAGTSGSVTIRGFGNDIARAALNIGTGTQSTSSTADNAVDFTGHLADLRLSTLTLGDQGLRVGGWNQSFAFDQGTLDVTNVDLGKACLEGTAGVSSMNLHGGVATIGTLNFLRANSATTATATLDVAGGAVVNLTGDVLKGSAAGVANLNVSGATVNTHGRIGNATHSIDNLVLNNATLTVDIPGINNPSAAPIWAGSFQPSEATLTVNGTGLSVGQFPLIAYSVLGGGGFDGLHLLNPPGVEAYLSNNTANSSIDLVVTSLNPLVWTGTPNGNWDVGGVANWTYQGSPASYNDGNRVLFDDTASGTANVNLTSALDPSTINFNNSSRNYVLAGTGRLTGSGGLAKVGSGTATIANSSVNDFTGATTISDGMLLVNSSIGGGNVNVLGGTLGGIGTVGGPVSVAPGASIAPGAGGIGTLTVSNIVTLQGTTLMEVDKAAAANDRLVAAGALTYGGLLQVTNLAGMLRGAESFKLFDAPSYKGSFAEITPPTPGPGLTWDLSRLAVDGTLKVVASFTPATNVALVKVGPSAFQISGSGGASQSYYVLSQTNVAAPMASWWVLGSTNADASGAINFVDTQATNQTQFYRFAQ